jgi:predicted ATPase
MVNSLVVPEVAGKPYDDLLVDFLSGKRLLLVLDNCEHLLKRVVEPAFRRVTVWSRRISTGAESLILIL